MTDTAIDRRLRAAERTGDELTTKVGEVQATLQVTTATVERLDKGIGAQHDEIIRAKAAFGGLSNMVTTELEKLNAKLDAKQEEEKVPPFSWLTTSDPAKAAEKLVELDKWVNEILVHFPSGTLADCWRRHPAAVEELLVLMEGHAEAWSPRGMAGLRFDWLNRWRPETMKRVAVILDKCSLLSEVHSGADPKWRRPQQPGKDQLDVPAWTQHHGQVQMPGPTEEALVEARARRATDMTAIYGATKAYA